MRAGEPLRGLPNKRDKGTCGTFEGFGTGSFDRVFTVLVPLGLFSLKRSSAGAFAEPFRVLI